MNYVFKNWKTICSISLMSLTTVMISAQQGENLVPNGGFESTDGKIKKLGSIESANGWTSPTGVRADVFTPSKVVDINTPENLYGKEAPKEGSNYAGIVAYSFGDKIPRSYITAKFDAPLKKGMKYCVQFHVSLAEASKYSVNNIGANLSKKPFATDTKSSIIDQTHILHHNNQIFNATYNWEKVCGVYEAEGGEKFITIGNFSKNDVMKTETNKKIKDVKVAQVISAYYYIDDVSVTLINSNEECDCMLTENENLYSTTIYQKAIIVNDKMTPQQKVEAQRAFFAFGKNKLNPSGEESLDQIVEIMNANPNMTLVVSGHSDAQEDEVGVEKPQYADMAEKRIYAAIAYLTSKGIAESRIKSENKGSAEPNPEIMDTDEDDLKMAKNRRLTFKLM